MSHPNSVSYTPEINRIINNPLLNKSSYLKKALYGRTDPKAYHGGFDDETRKYLKVQRTARETSITHEVGTFDNAMPFRRLNYVIDPEWVSENVYPAKKHHRQHLPVDHPKRKLIIVKDEAIQCSISD